MLGIDYYNYYSVWSLGANDQDDQVVEEIPCDAEPYNEDDMKYMQEAIDLCKESKDKNTKVSHHYSIQSCMYPKHNIYMACCNNYYTLYRLEVF